MKLTITICALAVLATPLATRAEVNYRLSPVMRNGQLQALRVEMRFPADADGVTDLQLPNHYRGEKDLYKYLNNLQITGASEVEAPTPDIRRLHSKPNADIVVSYRLDANLKVGIVPPADMTSLPVIAPDGFHVFGPDMFAWPKGRETEAARYEATFPRAWTIAASMSPSGGAVRDVIRSVVLGGINLRTVHLKIGDSDLTVASKGRFQFDMANMNRNLLHAMQTENDFWGEGPDHFLITLSQIDAGAGQTYEGTGVSNGFDVMATHNISPDILYLYNTHEYFHTWNPIALGGAEPEGATGYWFSEGLTDYYSRKLALRAGIIDLKAYISAWNMALNRYALSADRNAPNHQAAADFWSSDDAVSHTDYDRGAILAAQWNADWRARGVTLDQMMHAMQATAKADPDFVKLSFVARVTKVMDGFGIDERSDLQQHITDGVPILLTPDVLGGCLKVVTEQALVLDRGYDADKSGATGVFTGVNPDSNAYKAGLRDGMTYLARLSGDSDDATVPYSFRVKTPDGQPQIITYLPQGEATYERQRVVMPDNLTKAQVQTCTEDVADN